MFAALYLVQRGVQAHLTVFLEELRYLLYSFLYARGAILRSFAGKPSLTWLVHGILQVTDGAADSITRSQESSS